MKNGILILSLFLSTQLNAQENSKSIEINTKGYFVDGIFRLISSPTINWAKNNREIGIGPTFLLASVVAASSNQYPRLVGLQAHYRYFPNGNNNQLNLFLFEEITLQVINDTWETNEWNYTLSKYQAFEYTNREYLGLSNLGYGIILRLSEKISVSQSIGIGVYYSKSDSNEKTPGAPELFNEDQNINGYKDFGLTYGLNFVIQFKL